MNAPFNPLHTEVTASWQNVYGFDSDGTFYGRPLVPLPILGMSSIVEMDRTTFTLPNGMVRPRDLSIEANVCEDAFFHGHNDEHVYLSPRHAKLQFLISEIAEDETTIVPWSVARQNFQKFMTPRVRELILDIPREAVGLVGFDKFRAAAEQGPRG